MIVEFRYVPLGVAFQYLDHPDAGVWIKTNFNTVVRRWTMEWGTPWMGQNICCFVDTDDPEARRQKVRIVDDSNTVTACWDCPCHGSHYDDHIQRVKGSQYEDWCGHYERVYELSEGQRKPDWCDVTTIVVEEGNHDSD